MERSGTRSTALYSYFRRPKRCLQWCGTRSTAFQFTGFATNSPDLWHLLSFYFRRQAVISSVGCVCFGAANQRGNNGNQWHLSKGRAGTRPESREACATAERSSGSGGYVSSSRSSSAISAATTSRLHTVTLVERLIHVRRRTTKTIEAADHLQIGLCADTDVEQESEVVDVAA